MEEGSHFQFFLQKKIIATIIVSFLFGVVSTLVITQGFSQQTKQSTTISPTNGITSSPTQIDTPSPTIVTQTQCQVDDDCGNSPSCLPPPDECYLYKCISGRCQLEKVGETQQGKKCATADDCSGLECRDGYCIGLDYNMEQTKQ